MASGVDVERERVTRRKNKHLNLHQSIAMVATAYLKK